MHHTAAEAAACAGLSEAYAEPLAGTAAVAGSWLCLEQRGPWGHNALVQSHLDPGIGRTLAARGDEHGVRVQLIRPPGRHADTAAPQPRRVFLAHTGPDTGWLRSAVLTDPAELLDLDFARIAAGHHDGWGEPVAEPLLLVCTNGRRDRCCALLGRDLLTSLAGRHDGVLWESSHTGGHRFAPAAVLLPSGYTYGRLTPHATDAVLSAAAAGKVMLEHCRGRSTWTRAGQAAELAVREHIGEYLVDALRVTGEQDGEVEITHHDGRRWQVAVRHRELNPPRPSSCGRAAVRPTAVEVVGITARAAPGPPPTPTR
ncbi:sucrase ferredoxin [Saccharopolyspora subtropica]|uniref:Sucrase ferredoxin n=1 Tax=Saccharopolyspora thermophila TaxID=89367 RepID=A0A917JNV3_9PSEU|nr:sucrase ferredoxin [Saccharopolyspora subtropica]GGI79452.1 sucrase ferredoxin [Saccharopolyspora subtropica]